MGDVNSTEGTLTCVTPAYLCGLDNSNDKHNRGGRQVCETELGELLESGEKTTTM